MQLNLPYHLESLASTYHFEFLCLLLNCSLTLFGVLHSLDSPARNDL